MADTLFTLRDALKSKAAVQLLAADGSPTTTYSQFAQISIPVADGDALVVSKSEPSRFRKAADQGPYQIGAVFAAWLLRDSGAAEYLRSNRELGYPANLAVSVGDRKALVDWLEGRIAHHDRIEGAAGRSICRVARLEC